MFYASDKEKDLIAQKMKAAGMINREAYLRKMVLDGYIIHLDCSEIRKLRIELSFFSNNINQIAKKANSGGEIFADDIAEILKRQEQIWEGLRRAYKALADIPV